MLHLSLPLFPAKINTMQWLVRCNNSVTMVTKITNNWCIRSIKFIFYIVRIYTKVVAIIAYHCYICMEDQTHQCRYPFSGPKNCQRSLSSQRNFACLTLPVIFPPSKSIPTCIRNSLSPHKEWDPSVHC